MRMIPEGPSIRRGELVSEAFSWGDGPLSQSGHAIHGVQESYSVPMNGGLLVELVLDHHANRFALPDSEGGTGNHSVIGPHLGLWRALPEQGRSPRPRRETIFADSGAARRDWKRAYQRGACACQEQPPARNEAFGMYLHVLTLQRYGKWRRHREP